VKPEVSGKPVSDANAHIYRWTDKQETYRLQPHPPNGQGHYYSTGSRRLLNTQTHTRLTAIFLGLPRWADTRKVKPIWILLKQETVSGSGISWAICKTAPHSRHNHASTPALSFYRPDALAATQPTVSKHRRQFTATVQLGFISTEKDLPGSRCRESWQQTQRWSETRRRGTDLGGQTLLHATLQAN